MSIVCAALDATVAARPVLETAQCIARLTGAQVEVVHVTDGSIDTPVTLAERAGVPMRVLSGDPAVELVAAMARPEVLVGVIGARSTPGGRRPVGGTARAVLEQVDTPVVVVPPHYVCRRGFRRILVPLEGEPASTRAVLERLLPLIVGDVEVVVLHVFTELTLPMMLDRPHRDMAMMGREFLATHCPPAAAIEFRPGPVAQRVAEVAADHDIDLIVLSWSQVSTDGRARVVREVLGASNLPVMLLPVGDGRHAPPAPERPPGPAPEHMVAPTHAEPPGEPR